jgi:SAM-dependent methyltransferase
MIHCLEHIPAPAAFLRHVATLLAPDGRLLIEVPDLAANPFDPLVADHATHFLAASLRRTVAQAGLGIVACSDHWVPKELSVLAARAASAQAEPTLPVGQATASGAVRWLHGLLDLAAAQPGPLGIFGTSIAASWLAAQLGTRAAFFIDEDPDRVGNRHLGLPILAPSAAAADAVVMLPFPPAMARAIAARWPAIRGVCP